MYTRIFLIALFACSAVTAGTINDNLAEECKENPDKKVNLMLDLPSVESSVPSFFAENDIASKLRSSLRELTARSQEPILEAIKEIDPSLQLQYFWIANRIGVKDVSCEQAEKITNIPGQFAVRLEEVAKLLTSGPAKILASGTAAMAAIGQPQWGVEKINAPAVWNQTRGAGIVVANIDTGVRGSHVALAETHRKQFGWLDGFTNSSAGPPNDGNGHGTHTMGSICGKLGVGVAPDATWIACKGCDTNGCPEGALLTCGQWIYCPYNKIGDESTGDCSMRPRIVSNSWGGLGSADFYNPVIANWQKVGIIPIFAIGNEGPACSTTGSPGNQNDVIGVAATTKDDTLADFSSRGPFLSLRSLVKVKPELAAPGQDILSTWNTGDSAYATISGTSMATPHVAGAVALLLAKYPTLTYTQVLKTLSETAFRRNLSVLDSVNTCSCVGPLCRALKPEYPNNGYGNGRIDIQASFQQLSKA